MSVTTYAILGFAMMLILTAVLDAISSPPVILQNINIFNAFSPVLLNGCIEFSCNINIVMS